MASATTNHSAPISGSNALDVNSIYKTEQNVTHEINTNYEELQKSAPIDNSVTEDFISEDQNFDSLDASSIEEQSSLNIEENTSENNNVETENAAPQLFTGDEEIRDHDQEKSLADEIDTDLSDINFDDKDDLEIPAFLRRQTN